MTAAAPCRCISSALTTELLQFRNPQKEGEKWRLQEENRGSFLPFAARVIVTEIGVALLCVTAVVESVVYALLILPSVPLLLVSYQTWNWTSTHLSSSEFALFWNIQNLFSLNLSMINVATDESFARFSMDYDSPFIQSLRAVLKSNGFFTRTEDSIYIGDWLRENLDLQNSETLDQDVRKAFQTDEAKLKAQQIIALSFWTEMNKIKAENQVLREQSQALEAEIQARSEEAQALETERQILWENLRRLRELGQLPQEGPPEHLREAIKQGAEFFKEEILGEGKIDPASQPLVTELDADIIPFVLTRCIYCYAFGSKKDEPVPEFFKETTRQKLAKLREKHPSAEAVDLSDAVYSHLFDETQLSPNNLAVFNDLRGVAHEELQASVFLQCWQAALEEQISPERT